MTYKSIKDSVTSLLVTIQRITTPLLANRHEGREEERFVL